jgi:hypothetical protein
MTGRAGRELLYINGRSEMVSAEIQPGPTFSVGKQRTLFSASQFSRREPRGSLDSGAVDGQGPHGAIRIIV